VERKTAGLSLERTQDMVAGLPSKRKYCLSSKRDYKKALLVPFFVIQSIPIYHPINYSIYPLLNRDSKDRVYSSF
jgi:hypothetical protein